jgi:hypothetical protein
MEGKKHIRIGINGGTGKQEDLDSMLRGNLIFSKDYSSFVEKDMVAGLHIFIPVGSKSQTSIQSCLRFFEKLFNRERRLVTLPEMFYYALNEKHFSIKVYQGGNDIVIRLLAGEKLEQTLNELVQSLKSHPIQEVIDKDRTSIEFKIKTSESIGERIKAYCMDTSKIHLGYFLLDRSSVHIELNLDEESGDAIEKVIETIYPQYDLPHLTFFMDCDLSYNLHVSRETEESAEWDTKGAGRLLSAYLKSVIDSCIAYFRSMNDDELKNWAKMLKFLRIETEGIQFIYAEFTVKDVGWIELEIAMSGLLDLLELLMFHPFNSQFEKLQIFKMKFLQRFDKN